MLININFTKIIWTTRFSFSLLQIEKNPKSYLKREFYFKRYRNCTLTSDFVFLLI